MDRKIKKIQTDDRGNSLYVEETEQGRCYWSDEIGGGVQVWHTALVSPQMLRMALEAEERTNLPSPPVGKNRDSVDQNNTALREALRRRIQFCLESYQRAQTPGEREAWIIEREAMDAMLARISDQEDTHQP